MVASPSRQAPNDLEAEMSVLSAMLISRDCAGDIGQKLEPDDFYKTAHQHVFAACRKLFDENVEVDHITLADLLERENSLESVGGREYLYVLSEYLPSPVSAAHHAEIVRSKSVLRKLISITSELAQKAYDAKDQPAVLLDEAEAKIFEIARKNEVSEPASIQDLLTRTFENIERIRGSGSRTTGVPTGYIDLDDLTAGLQPGELIIIAARPSMGKTSFAMNLMDRAAAQGYPTAFFSLETTSQQVIQNLLCSRAQIDAQKLRRGFVSNTEFLRLKECASRLYEQKIYVDDTSSLTLMALRAKARRLKQKHDIKLLIIDYLQLMSVGARVESRQQEIALISRSLKGLAKELSLPVVALSQLNRSVEQRDSHRPRMSDLRESGAIEQDADVVMMLHREDYYNETEENRGLAEIILSKQRNGPTGLVKLRFIKNYMRFESYTRQPEPIT